METRNEYTSMACVRLLLAIVLFAQVAWSLAPLHTVTNAIPDEYIVKLNVDKSDFNATLERHRQIILAAKGTMMGTFELITAYGARMNAATLQKIREDSAVEYVEQNAEARIAGNTTPSNGQARQTWGGAVLTACAFITALVMGTILYA